MEGKGKKRRDDLMNARGKTFDGQLNERNGSGWQGKEKGIINGEEKGKRDGMDKGNYCFGCLGENFI